MQLLVVFLSIIVLAALFFAGLLALLRLRLDESHYAAPTSPAENFVPPPEKTGDRRSSGMSSSSG
ncbi:MAG: hypothetical protein ABSH33_10095 [Steroidobacteraceae bacterium]|jgi:hypothetical protein